MFDPSTVTIVAIGLFALQAVMHILINPYALLEEPTSPNADEMTAQRGSRAIALFAVVLVVVNFILDPTSEMVNPQSPALVTTIIAAGFLMVAFSLEVIGVLNVFLFKVQEDSLTYAGLLLFTGLYFLVADVDAPPILAIFILSFLILSWIIWISYKFDYLRNIQLKEWEAVDYTRWQVAKRAVIVYKRTLTFFLLAILISIVVIVCV